MKKRTIAGHHVGEIGLGCMGMSFAYGPGDDAESQQVLRRALEIGVDFWDTADMYGAGANEKLLATVLKDVRDQVFLATKFGNVYDKSMTSHQDQVQANVGWIVDGTPDYAYKCIDLSLQRLGVDHVDLYYLHRVDNLVPIEETVGAMAEIVKAGKAKNIGLSEASVDTIKRAHKVHKIAAVQSEFSLWTRDYANTVIPLCKELGIAFVPYSPLGRGFLTGQIKTIDDLPADDWRRSNPRFQGDNFIENLRIVDKVESIAKNHGAAPAQVALAWVLAQGDHLIPIPGTKKLQYLEQNSAAGDLVLKTEEIAELTKIDGPAGARYPEMAMGMINR